MNRDFQGYVTSQAFVISLSAPQIEALFWVGTANYRKNASFVPHLISIQSLSRKGLIRRDAHRFSDPWVITEEGNLVLELCKRAGLLASYFRTVNKAAA